MKRLLAELDEIKEVVVLYPHKRRAKTAPQHTVLSKTSELQQSLLSILHVKPEAFARLPPFGGWRPRRSAAFTD